MEPDTLAVWKNIETHLGVPLRQNMVDLLLEMARDRSIDPKRIALWMLTTSTCICNAVFGSDCPMPLLSIYIQMLLIHYPDKMDQIAQEYKHGCASQYVPVIADQDELIGILSAAGATFANGELTLKEDKISITPKGFERFELIWKVPTQKLENHEDNPGISVIG